ncbi:MAG: putative HTH-type transcriptional regulator, TetR family [Proteobacteria bacterium]|nr:putative HTH-type transcriptional regulator, TetR family [Pseudomonadota bacterium]
MTGERDDRTSLTGEGSGRGTKPPRPKIRRRPTEEKKAERARPAGKPRDADATRAKVLQAAIAEFADKGLTGARVDEIAARAGFNKRMLYHYFGSKEELFEAVLEAVYTDVWEAEAALDLDGLPADQALAQLVAFTWTYYVSHPEFMTLLNHENLLRARHFRPTETVGSKARQSLDLAARILDRGVAAGLFRPGIDPVQLNITISAIGYYYLTNRYTASIVYERDMATPEAYAARLQFNIETILAMVAI